MLRRVKRGAGKAHIEAHGAAAPALRVALHAFRAGEPVLHVIIRIDEGDVHFLGEADVLVLADFIFTQWVNVRVVKEYRKVDAVGDDLLHQLTGAGRAAGMHEHLIRAIGRGQIDMLNDFGCVFGLVHGSVLAYTADECKGCGNSSACPPINDLSRALELPQM